jgi:hypothetical protein
VNCFFIEFQNRTKSYAIWFNKKKLIFRIPEKWPLHKLSDQFPSIAVRGIIPGIIILFDMVICPIIYIMLNRICKIKEQLIRCCFLSPRLNHTRLHQ